MKHLALTTLMTLVSSLALAAGGTGGGGWKPGPLAMKISQDSLFNREGGVSSGSSGGGDRPREIVFNMGQKNGLVRFAYGQFLDKKWHVQKFELSEPDVSTDSEVLAALQKSKEFKSWVEVN